MKKLFSFATIALLIASALPASADSPLTSTEVSSKTATHVGPTPYTGHDSSPKEAAKIVSAGLQTIKASHASPTVGLAVIQRVDSATMSNPQAQAAFKQGLQAVVREG